MVSLGSKPLSASVEARKGADSSHPSVGSFTIVIQAFRRILSSRPSEHSGSCRWGLERKEGNAYSTLPRPNGKARLTRSPRPSPALS